MPRSSSSTTPTPSTPQGRGAGEVPQHRPGVHLPQPDVRAAGHRRGVRRACWPTGSARCRPARARRRRADRPAHRRAALGKVRAPGRRRRGQGRQRGDRRRRLDGGAAGRRRLLRPHGAHRRHPRHADLPRGDVRPHRPGHRVRRRGRGRSPWPTTPTTGWPSYVYTNDLSRACRGWRRCDFGIIGINDINPTVGRGALRWRQGERAWAGRAARDGLAEYLDTKLRRVRRCEQLPRPNPPRAEALEPTTRATSSGCPNGASTTGPWIDRILDEAVVSHLG